MTHTEIIRNYNRLSAAHKYIVGYIVKKSVYYVTLSWNELKKYLKPDHTSSNRGGCRTVRVRLTAEDRKALMTRATYACEISELSADPEYNKGDNFERVITELLTDTIWVKNSVPFWQAGDIRVDGEEIQVKLDTATLTTESTMTKLMKKLGG